MSLENRARSQRWFEEVWNERRTDVVDEFLGPESVGHLEGGDVVGAGPFKALQAEFLKALPDLRLEVEAVISDGDDVVVRWVARGTHTGDGLGCAASGCAVQFRGITWHRYRDGRLVEGWDSWNQGGLLQQLQGGGGGGASGGPGA